MSVTQNLSNPTATPQDNVAPIVDVGNVIASDSNAEFISTIGNKLPIDFQMTNSYSKDGQIFTLPIASPQGFQGASVTFIQLASPTLTWTCDWTTAKMNDQPEIPDPYSTDDSGWILLGDQIELNKIVLAPDGESPLYRISGTYIYSHLNPNSITVNHSRFGRPSWIKDSFNRFMPVSKLTPGLSTTSSVVRIKNVKV